ncbi:MAG: YhcH/YjgK/YiaL family protein [Bacilli bacterium]|nr:YhcH/YjgK/YiaL family protein [Bacilli bacterium]
MRVDDWDLLLKISPLVFEYIKNENLSFFDDGKYILKDGVIMNVDSYLTQERTSRVFESHRKYIDVQYIVSGEELISVKDIDDLDPTSSYDKQKDIIFYKSDVMGIDFILKEKQFLVLRSNDAHMPCICVSKPNVVKKIVFKVPLL